LTYIAMLLSYFFIKLPIKLPSEIRLYLIGGEMFLGIIVFFLSYFVKKQYIPTSIHEPYWSYKAMKGYFWPYAIASAPFFVRWYILPYICRPYKPKRWFFHKFFCCFLSKAQKR
jgi:hypothetical protein